MDGCAADLIAALCFAAQKIGKVCANLQWIELNFNCLKKKLKQILHSLSFVLLVKAFRKLYIL